MFLRYLSVLVNGTERFVAAERRYDALDLPPMAEARDVAVVAAALGADRRLEACVIAETLDQIGSVGERETAVDEGTVHRHSFTPGPVSRLPTNVVNKPLTMFLDPLRNDPRFQAIVRRMNFPA